MAFEGQYKLDDGTNVVMDCFPIRKIFKGGYQSAGHWVEAQRSSKQKGFQAVFGPKPPIQRTLVAPSPAYKPHCANEKVLDGNYLMELHCVDNQSDLCVVNISDQDLNAVNEEDFHLFDSVAYINAAANHLPFEPFRLFPSLKELDLSANGLRNLSLIAQDFPNLQVLNLSYNKVCKEDILTLGILPQLKVLHLTGNDLDSLPLDLTIPHDPVDRSEEPLLRFPVLEILMLDENRFSDPCVFSSLASLHRLKYLNLDQNSFTGVPYLQQMEPSAPSEKTGSQHHHLIVSQNKHPITCPSVTSVEVPVFQSDVEVEGYFRERVGEGEREGEGKEGGQVWEGERVGEVERVNQEVREEGEGVEQEERVGQGASVGKESMGKRVEEGRVNNGERILEENRPGEVERVEQGESEKEGERVGMEQGQGVGKGVGIEQGQKVMDGERVRELEEVEYGERVEVGDKMGEGEQREQGDEEQKKVEKDGKGKTGEEEKEMTGKEVDKDKEIEEGEKMKSSVPEPFHLPACLDKILGETSATVEGQETMEQLLEPLETKSMCVPKAPYEFLPPFSGLRHLSLAKNKISDDEELFAVCLFPALNKLTIYDNPITLRSGKNPHVAISILKDRLGVEVITSASQPVDRPPMAKVFNPKRKIDTHIPKIPKQPLSLETAKKLLGLEHVGTTRQGEVEPDPPVQVDDNGIELSSALYERCRTDSSIPEASSGTPEDQHQNPMEGKPVGGFFLTQVEDAAFNNEDTVTLETKQAAEPLVTTELPEKYRGYEQLLDATTDPHFVEPVGIQQNVRQLERRLRKLQLYPDPFASGVWQGARHIPKQRKLRKLPESMSHRSKADKMEEILKRMKDQKAVTVIPLAHVLRGEGVSRQEDEEAVALLSDLQLKYLELRGRLAAKVSKLSEELGGKEADPKSAGHQPGGVRKGCGTSPPRSSYF